MRFRSTGGSDQDHPQEKEMQKDKMVVWGGLTNSCEKIHKSKLELDHKNLYNTQIVQLEQGNKEEFSKSPA